MEIERKITTPEGYEVANVEVVDGAAVAAVVTFKPQGCTE